MPNDERGNSNHPPETPETKDKKSISRRKFVAGVGAITGFAVSAPVISRAGTLEPPAQAAAEAGNSVPLEITINGTVHRLSVDPRVTLLDLLRENLGLTGTKKGCDHGQCGSCTVLADGRRINSCLSLAAVHDGERITTVEGLASHNGDLDPLQAAFLEHDGFQCGYCTPGQLCSATAMLKEFDRGDASVVTTDLSAHAADLTPAEICERMSGNICRCGAYPGIVAAVQEAHKGGRSGQ
jgi:xanthine dehydrogenase YagT iron-sulfur-binding subunit